MRSEMKKPGRLIPLNCVDECELALDDINEPALKFTTTRFLRFLDRQKMSANPVKMFLNLYIGEIENYPVGPEGS
jgi:hypothetical protein